MVKRIFLFIVLLSVSVFLGCAETSTSDIAQTYDKIADVGIITHNHWTQEDVNDGHIVWIGLINTRNEYISDNIEGLTINLSIKGSNGSTKDLAVSLFDKTYYNVNLSDSDYPKGQGFTILFNDLIGYEPMSFAGIWATVTLPDGRVVKNHDPYAFDVEPTIYGKL